MKTFRVYLDSDEKMVKAENIWDVGQFLHDYWKAINQGHDTYPNRLYNFMFRFYLPKNNNSQN